MLCDALLWMSTAGMANSFTHLVLLMQLLSCASLQRVALSMGCLAEAAYGHAGHSDVSNPGLSPLC